MVLSELKQIVGEDLINITQDVRSGIPTAVFGVTLGEKARISALFDKVCYIAPDLISARQMVVELENLTGQTFALLPPKNEVLLSKSAINKDILHERISALYKIQKQHTSVITTLEAIMQLVPKKIEIVSLQKNINVNTDELIEKLVYIGYKRVDFVQEVGQFAIRGDIFDIYPINSTSAYRIDFFYDEIEKIVEFDFESGEKGQEKEEIVIVQAYDFNVYDENADIIWNKLSKSFSTHTISSSKHKLSNYACDLIDLLKSGYDDRLGALMPLMDGVTF